LIKKIISGGQTGADQAALDAAIKWNIPHGGWVPKGRLTEAGRLSDRYNMLEMPTDSYPARTEKNVADSDGSLIISYGPLSDGSKHTKETALKRNKPCLHIDLNEIDASKAAGQAHEWITKSGIETLNVAGPRASNDPSIYQAVMHVLTIVLIMDFVEIKMSEPKKKLPFKPVSLDKAVNILISKISLRERCCIANLDKNDLGYLDVTIGKYIRNNFGIKSGHIELIKECRDISGREEITDNELSSTLITELWEKLRATHTLRIIK